MGPGHQHSFPAGGDHCIAAQAGATRPFRRSPSPPISRPIGFGSTSRASVISPPRTKGPSTCDPGAFPPNTDIIATGIPIHPVFSEPKDRGECLAAPRAGGRSAGHPAAGRRLRRRPDRKALPGSPGGGAVPLEVVVVTGRNEKAQGTASEVPCPDRHRVKMLGFTEQIDELMAVADLVVSKPGGLTTSETLARGAAMVIVNPDPRTGKPQQRFLAGERGGHQGQQHRHPGP